MTRWFKVRWGWTATVLTAWAGCLALLWLTGLVLSLLPASELLDMTPLAQAGRHVCVVLHGGLIWVLCLLTGRGLWPHLDAMWHRRGDRRRWWWGLISLAVLAVLALSGLVLLYGEQAWHDVSSDLHVGVGLLTPLVLLTHVRFRRSAQSNVRASNSFRSR
jgi:hypothetical protein